MFKQILLNPPPPLLRCAVEAMKSLHLVIFTAVVAIKLWLLVTDAETYRNKDLVFSMRNILNV
jgi:hypothetical protein